MRACGVWDNTYKFGTPYISDKSMRACGVKDNTYKFGTPYMSDKSVIS